MSVGSQNQFITNITEGISIFRDILRPIK